MRFQIEAACGCHTGRIRRNNEDNFYFDGRCLEAVHNGLPNPVCIEMPVKNGLSMAVFDGMGGENFGEIASFTAAKTMQQMERTLADFFLPERKYLNRLVSRLNEAVVAAEKELMTDRMGTTMAALYFTTRYVYVCNVGDSRVYRLRSGQFQQISEDHVAHLPGMTRRKAPLTQHLGIDPEEMMIEPYVAKGELKPGDQYLICSDGVTDMLTNIEIADILLRTADADSCVRELIREALEHGGRDNITAILCRIS